MPQCSQCYFDSPAYSQYCSQCGNSLIIEPTVSTTQTQIPELPPTIIKKRRSRTFIPGLGTFGLFRQDPHTGKWGCAPGCLISALLAVILILGGLLFFSQQHPPGPLNLSSSGSPAPRSANLSINGNPTPGKLLSIHGSNFPPNSSVGILLDGTPYASTRHLLPMASASLWSIIKQEETLYPSDTTVTTGSDGTFDTKIAIPSSWTPGSKHVIQAQTIAKNSTATAEVQVTITEKQAGPVQHYNPTPMATSTPPLIPPHRPSPTPTATSAPPVVPTVTPSPTPTATSAPPIIVPTITSISPSSGSSAGGTSVTITGTGFTGVTSVSFGASVVAQGNFSVDNDTQITAISPAGSNTVDITATTPTGTSTLNSADQFMYNAPPPTITSISPSSGSSIGGTSVVIAGTDFTGVTSISFGSSAVTQGNVTVDNDTQITVTSPAGSGTVDVTVTTASGTSATSSADQFTYNVPPPTITSISPSGGSSAGGTSVIITGTGFTGATNVSFGSSAVIEGNFTIDSDTQITVVKSPAGSGTVDITVTTTSGTSDTGAADQFTYNVPPPIITSISPSSGSSTGGTSVVITGTGFTGATSVSFGSSAIAQGNFTVDSDTSITVISPAGTGVVDVTVTTVSGTSATGSSADQFTYNAPPPILPGPVK